MISRSAPAILLTILGTAVPALGQIPAHATLLNPSGLLNYSQHLMVVSDGNTLHEMHSVRTNILVSGASVFDRYYSRSADAGRTWSTTDRLLGSSSMAPIIAADGDNVVVLLFHHTLGPHIVSSFDGGANWGAPLAVSQQYVVPPGQWRDPQAKVHVDGNTVNVFWHGARASGLLWTNRSTDGGLTWSPTDIALDTGAYPDSVYATHVVDDAGSIHLLWGRVSGGVSSTHRQTSADGGATWLPAPQTVNVVLGQVHGTGLHLFQRSPNGLLHRSSDAGLSWTLSTGHGMSTSCEVAMAGQTVLLGQGGPPNSTSVELTVSRDGGVTWLPTPFVIPVAIVRSVDVLVQSDALFAVIDTYTTSWVVQSDDFGLDWRLVSGGANGSEQLWGSRAGVIATRFTGSLWAYMLAGHTTRGRGTPGTGGTVPRLDGVGLPSIARTFALRVGDANANALGAVFASFEPAAPALVGTTTIYVQPPIAPLVFVTSAAGDASRSVTVPANPAFAGLTLTSQALVVDPNGIGGFTATRAIETWIH